MTRRIIEELERDFGRPVLAAAAAEFNDHEFGLLRRCAVQGRFHDVTLLIRDDADRLALIRKPNYPPDVFRPPSGGVEPGETAEEGARREAQEETGLRVRLERYILRVEASFTCAGAENPWSTHVLLARAESGNLDPVDRKEIAAARWATVEQVLRCYRPAMLGWGTPGMRYRVELQDAAFRALGWAEPGLLPPPRVLREPDGAADPRNR